MKSNFLTKFIKVAFSFLLKMKEIIFIQQYEDSNGK